ncbi:UDP-glucosyltransferase 2-like isoform X3 [Schistocerca serialis cubense]|uniref:UDP-glucosyltransferase 2-like isoform X3 n=1 Tax=Schistocerca serialis cubense TaxID=2023355 RepID=UPI00214EDF21|nr:UDP-glucosyltransferase 2-like isoform X3 [Schistocerca serialis cubense]
MSLVSCADGRKWQRFWQCIFLLTGVITQCQGANILSVMSVPSKSHMVFLSPLLHELAQRGHNLTVISPFPQSPPVKNIRDIKLNVTMDSFRKERNMSLFEMGEVNPFILLLFSSTIGSSMCKNAISTPEVQDLITSNNQKFDLLIAGVFTECFLGLAHKHNASIIQQIPNTLAFVMGDAVGNPAAYAYIPDIMLDIPVNMNFLQRTLNSMYGLLVELLRFFVYVPNQQEIMVSYSKNIDNLPSVEKLFKSSSLVLINNHESIGLSRPLTPNTIQVGGMHIKPAKDLPKDLKTILDNSKEGVIFFSLGTNVQASEMPNDKFIAFMKAFSKLKQEVLWKWDQDTMVGKPNNVHLGKWFPQNDILGTGSVQQSCRNCSMTSPSSLWSAPSSGLSMCCGTVVQHTCAVQHWTSTGGSWHCLMLQPPLQSARWYQCCSASLWFAGAAEGMLHQKSVPSQRKNGDDVNALRPQGTAY